MFVNFCTARPFFIIIIKKIIELYSTHPQFCMILHSQFYMYKSNIPLCI